MKIGPSVASGDFVLTTISPNADNETENERGLAGALKISDLTNVTTRITYFLS
jgi:hypothetical protein